MSRATPRIRDLAERLIAYEATRNGSSGTKRAGVFPVCEKLRPHLATLMGNTGVRSLLSRALTLTLDEGDWLRTIQVNKDGFLDGFDELEVQADPDDLAKGSVVLVAQLLGLLVAFIGKKLTVQLVRDIWPKLPLSDLDLK